MTERACNRKQCCLLKKQRQDKHIVEAWLLTGTATWAAPRRRREIPAGRWRDWAELGRLERTRGSGAFIYAGSPVFLWFIFSRCSPSVPRRVATALIIDKWTQCPQRQDCCCCELCAAFVEEWPNQGEAKCTEVFNSRVGSNLRLLVFCLVNCQLSKMH